MDVSRETSELRRGVPCTLCGGVAEWLNAAVSKTVSPATPVTRVRIPPPPPFESYANPRSGRLLGGVRCVFGSAVAVAEPCLLFSMLHRPAHARLSCGFGSPLRSGAVGNRLTRRAFCAPVVPARRATGFPRTLIGQPPGVSAVLPAGCPRSLRYRPPGADRMIVPPVRLLRPSDCSAR